MMRNKSKQDRMQDDLSFPAPYLIIACMRLAAQHLAVSTLELNSLGMAMFAGMTVFP